MFYIQLMLAGGLGTVFRFLLSRASVQLGWTALPFGTLLANMLGSFLIGYLSWVLINKWPVSRELQTVLITGFLGGFTTFSAFSLETVQLFQQGFSGKALLYIVFSVGLSITMCVLGLMLAKHT